MNKTFFKILGMAAFGIAFSACSKSDIFEDQGEAIASQHRADYVTNFINKYGPVDPNQSWDLSRGLPEYSLTPWHEATSRAAVTRGTDSYSRTKSPGFVVKQEVLSWFFQNTPAGHNNTEQGKPFFMMVSQEDFTIVPIFQGNAKKYWQLWMHVDGLQNDVKVWEKGEDLGYRTTDNGELITVGTGQSGVSKQAYEVVAPAITFSGMPTGKMHFYLKAWNDEDAYNNDTDKNRYATISSLSRKMLSMNCPKPDGVPANASYRIIGCEDASDNDYEDLAFIIYGDFTITEPTIVYETIPKRYMVEDLGSTDDFDFNDIVVDAYNEYKTTYTYSYKSDGTIELVSTEGPELIGQWAVVRAAGGTLDFTIKIGSTTWKKSDHVTPVTEMVNTGIGGAINYNGKIDEFVIKDMDWDAVHDNITIEVDGRGRNLGVQYITFPKDGEIPMIIAVDTSVNWMHERNSVPKSWFYE